MTKLVRVNTLAVAKRWKKQLVNEKKTATGINKRVGIWELPYQSDDSDYTHTSDTRYVVGNIQAVRSRVRNLGERVDEV